MEQLPLDLGYRPAALGSADFLVAPSNEAAVGWLDRWPNWPAPGLALYGPPGSGKTHLANVWRLKSDAVVIPPETLTTRSIPALLGAGRLAIVDEADRADEEALLHLYNLVAERRGHLLMVAREAPARWSIALPDLRSRLLAIPAIAIQPPDDALLAALLVKLFADRQLKVGQDLIEFLLVRIERSFDAARAAVAALDAAGLSVNRSLTVPFAREVLRRGGIGRDEDR
jgi:chromosomal replication initiation ATPase DnaA